MLLMNHKVMSFHTFAPNSKLGRRRNTTTSLSQNHRTTRLVSHGCVDVAHSCGRKTSRMPTIDDKDHKVVVLSGFHKVVARFSSPAQRRTPIVLKYETPTNAAADTCIPSDFTECHNPSQSTRLSVDCVVITGQPRYRRNFKDHKVVDTTHPRTTGIQRNQS